MTHRCTQAKSGECDGCEADMVRGETARAERVYEDPRSASGRDADWNHVRGPYYPRGL